MIIVRFRETFRERCSEWIQAAGMLAWGLFTLNSTNLFKEQIFFRPLLDLMCQETWGALTVFVGIIRLTFLVINGAWRPSAHIRAVGCVFGTFLWSSLLLASLGLDWLTPTTALYAMLLVLDLLSLWFAAGDAKLADLSARGELEKH